MNNRIKLVTKVIDDGKIVVINNKKPLKKILQGAFLFFKHTTIYHLLYDAGKLSDVYTNSIANHHYTIKSAV